LIAMKGVFLKLTLSNKWLLLQQAQSYFNLKSGIWIKHWAPDLQLYFNLKSRIGIKHWALDLQSYFNLKSGIWIKYWAPDLQSYFNLNSRIGIKHWAPDLHSNNIPLRKDVHTFGGISLNKSSELRNKIYSILHHP